MLDLRWAWWLSCITCNACAPNGEYASHALHACHAPSYHHMHERTYKERQVTKGLNQSIEGNQEKVRNQRVC